MKRTNSLLFINLKGFVEHINVFIFGYDGLLISTLLGDPSLFIYASFCFIYDPLFLNAQPFGVFYELFPDLYRTFVSYVIICACRPVPPSKKSRTAGGDPKNLNYYHKDFFLFSSERMEPN